MILTPRRNAEMQILTDKGSLRSERKEKAVNPSEQKNAILLTLEIFFGCKCVFDLGTGSPQP